VFGTVPSVRQRCNFNYCDVREDIVRKEGMECYEEDGVLDVMGRCMKFRTKEIISRLSSVGNFRLARP
jgi:hypothetical protein